ncbi:MAG TPA: FkbM family methyltransferase [Candidatus Acidoferrum sp.]|nr:FkbM family methyltransferase [Candidatus Acidoferrum sp.]
MADYLSDVPSNMDLYTNAAPAFTTWIVERGDLETPFVLVDVGVQGGEHPRWRALGDALIVHGFDALPSAIEELKSRCPDDARRQYHWTAVSDVDGRRDFFVSSDPYSSSFLPSTTDGRTTQAMPVDVRRLDTLLDEGVVPPADFLKTDVEGGERQVLDGAPRLLAGLLGFETETSLNRSPIYPDGHFPTLARLVQGHGLLPIDLNFNRVVRERFQQALERKGASRIRRDDWLGGPATFNVLFCRDVVQERDHPEYYPGGPAALSVDRLIKLMMIHELYGLNDVAVDIAETHRSMLHMRIDVDGAIDRLTQPDARGRPWVVVAHELAGQLAESRQDADRLRERVAELLGRLAALESEAATAREAARPE